MPYTIIYFDEARLGINCNKRLQKRFAIAIKKTVARLQNHATAFAIRFKNIRIAHSDIFPYGIHFYIDDERKQIGIIGVIHNSRIKRFKNGFLSINSIRPL